MHEASLMANLMRRIESVAAAEGAARIVRVSVRLGALSHMSPEHFSEHFARASAGGIAAGAALDVVVGEDAKDSNAADVLLECVEVET